MLLSKEPFQSPEPRFVARVRFAMKFWLEMVGRGSHIPEATPIFSSRLPSETFPLEVFSFPRPILSPAL